MDILKIFLLCMVTTQISAIKNYQYDTGPVSVLSSCPGYYCGRSLLENGSWSPCGPCEIGYRRNESSACILCNDSPSFYDWLYLGFMAFLALNFHILSIVFNEDTKKVTVQCVLMYLLPVFEITLSAFASLLLFSPSGSLTLQSCNVRKLPDWYPIFHNPNPSYEGYLHCTQEAVFPLYSIVFVFYTMCMLTMILVRPWVAPKLLIEGKNTIYYALYFLPLLMVIHAVFAGLIYYAFPYIIIVASLLANAYFFAILKHEPMKGLILETVCDPRRAIIMIFHWGAHAYGIIAVDLLEHPVFLVLVPVPALFYILTSKHSNPSIRFF